MKPACAVVKMEIHLSLKLDSNLLYLNTIMLHSDVVEAAKFRLFYFDSNGESVDTLTPTSLSILMSLRDQVSYMFFITISLLELPRNMEVSMIK